MADDHAPEHGDWGSWEDNPPPPEEPPPYDDAGYDPGFAEPPPRRTRRSRPEGQDTVDVIGVLRTVLAAQHGKTFDELAAMVRDIQVADKVIETLGEEQQEAYKGVLEALIDLATNCEGGQVDLRKVPTARLYDASVQRELDAIAALCETMSPELNPSAAWFGVKEAVQRQTAERSALAYLRKLAERAPIAETIETFKRIEPPTTRKASVRARAAKTAAQVIAEHRQATAGQQKVRLSSGFRTLDIAFTGPGEPLGFIGLGEGSVVAAPTGNGKSSWTYVVVPGLAQDLVNWNLPEAKIIFAHTEEESHDKIEAMLLGDGQAFHHLADNVVVANVGTSRKLLAMTIYDCVAEAHVLSMESGRPITHFLPYALVLDYVQSISEQGESEVQATMATAEFLLRGVQAWNPDEMAKFSGLSYQEYTGSAWPTGQEHHRVAGIYMAQLVKQDDKSLLYKPGARDCVLSDFALEDTSEKPVWRDDKGGGWAWPVQEGDLRLFKQNAIRGSGVILQNATTILILHRSRPYNNPKREGPDGRTHLEDVRARFLLDKTRLGSNLQFIPMGFDSDQDGRRGRFYDIGAEQAIVEGRFYPHETWGRPGDPILPLRQAASPLDGVKY